MAFKTRKVRFLMVVCNPFAALHQVDEDEVRCAGAFPHEPTPVALGGDTEVRHIGAKRVVAQLRAPGPGSKESIGRDPGLYDRAFEFTHEPVKVNRSEYYRRALREGPAGSRALLPADAETHKWAGLPGPFVDPMRTIAQKSMELGDLLPAHLGELQEEAAPEPNLAVDEDEGEEDKPVVHGEGAEAPAELEPKWASLLAPHKAKLREGHPSPEAPEVTERRLAAEAKKLAEAEHEEPHAEAPAVQHTAEDHVAADHHDA